MHKSLATLIIPAALALSIGAPSFAQVRIGVDLGTVRIRIAPDAPPRPRWERRPPQPSQQYVWIAGYWDRQDDRWGWAPGRWEAPAQLDSHWIRPMYVREGSAYRYEPGRWSHQRMEEGEDYSNWHREHGRGHEKHKGHGHGHGHGHDDDD